MGMQDRDWYREEQRQNRAGKQYKGDVPAKRARPVFFVHLLAGFKTGLIAGVLIGLTIGLLIAK